MKDENIKPVFKLSNKIFKILKGEKCEIRERLERLDQIDCKIKMLSEIKICNE